MSDPNDNSIPVLSEVLVPGHTAQRREPQSGGAAPDAPAAAPADAPLREPEALRKTDITAEPELAPQPVLTPEETLAPEPVLAPQPLGAEIGAGAAARSAADRAHSTDHVHPAHHAPQPDHAHVINKSRPHLAAEADHAHDDALAASAATFDRTEPPPPFEAAATVPPDIAQEADTQAPSGVDAGHIGERVRERFADFLAGDGRGVIEARCRSAVEEHTARLVDQITREVVMTLESEMAGWVREAVEAEIARQSGRA
ncbi:DUF2486 family protein [Paraburkholderia dilworthii]|uniref:DUF2486 family protein n=1 Tax=Paraburkholderia dilworthii TaxID=948106 RepID=UPI00041F65DC|nr:DUF2486 family protein [Paraburkholderia dilworthii]